MGRPRSEYGHDVWLLELGGEPNLAGEPFDAEPLRELGGEDLHDDGSTQRLLTRHEQARHAAAAQLTLEGVGRSERSFEFFAQ